MAICLTDLLYMLWILRFKTALELEEIPVLHTSWHLTFLRIKFHESAYSTSQNSAWADITPVVSKLSL